MNSKTKPYQLIFVNRPQVQFLPRWIGRQAISRWLTIQRQNGQPKLTADQIVANQLRPIDNHPSNSETRIDNESK